MGECATKGVVIKNKAATCKDYLPVKQGCLPKARGMRRRIHSGLRSLRVK